MAISNSGGKNLTANNDTIRVYYYSSTREFGSKV